MEVWTNYEYDAEQRKNVFWLSSDRDIYEFGPFATLSAAERYAAEKGLEFLGNDVDALSAERENENGVER